ncbi:hypothetical protein C8R46DRAFT_1341379 [Mycena filopes]|nr:hypothetical protein C8R46DRAFT_1341379 [Mycena filopes]
MTSLPAKRQRTEDARITRSEVWYSDGSVVLQAENTQFRVHWSILGVNSSFFRDMQGLPQPPDEASVDGCPVVVLHDAVLDVEHLLKVLYDPTFLLQESLPFPVVASLVRLGKKYDFRSLFDSAVARFTFENPSTLAEYDLRFKNQAGGTPRITPYPGIRYDMLALARENNILSALPCCYLRAMFMPTASYFDGIARGDGTRASLASIDQRRCIIGSERLRAIQFKPGYTCAWLHKWDYDEDCIDPSKCTRTRANALQNYLYGRGNVWALTTTRQDTHLCAACSVHCKESIEMGKERVWAELPAFFDLPPWAELKND